MQNVNLLVYVALATPCVLYKKRGAQKLPMFLHNIICKMFNFCINDCFQKMVILFGDASPKENGASIKLAINGDGRIVCVCVCVAGGPGSGGWGGVRVFVY